MKEDFERWTIGNETSYCAFKFDLSDIDIFATVTGSLLSNIQTKFNGVFSKVGYIPSQIQLGSVALDELETFLRVRESNVVKAIG